jgi:stage II sporulation protein B
LDKPKNGNTITIKLNGEKQTFVDESKEKDLEPAGNQYPTVIIDSNSLDQEGFLETAAAKESVDESFDWIIPESSENDIEEYKIVSSESQKSSKKGKVNISSFSTKSLKANGSALKSSVFSVIFAIILGIGFGFLMLKLVINGHSPKSATTTVSNVAVQPNTESSNSDQTVTHSGTKTIKPVNFFVVQGGVYSTKDSAKGASDQMAGQGIPAITFGMNGKEYLFLGVTDSLDSAKQLISYYKEKGIDDIPITKTITTEEKTVSNLTDEEKSFLEASPDIFQDLSKVTSSAILSRTLGSNSLKSAEDHLNKIDNKNIKSDDIKKLKNDLASAVDKIKAYQKSKSTKNLTEAQQKLLNFLSTYYSM